MRRRVSARDTYRSMCDWSGSSWQQSPPSSIFLTDAGQLHKMVVTDLLFLPLLSSFDLLWPSQTLPSPLGTSETHSGIERGEC